mgnify:CR=1 FL=1|jgi:hypothetical protein
MDDKTFIKFLQEQAGMNNVKVRFLLPEFMEWAGIPYQELEAVDVTNKVTNLLKRLMNCMSKVEQEIFSLKSIRLSRIVSSFFSVGPIIEVDFAEITQFIREQDEDWLVKIYEEMEDDNERQKN